MPDTIPTETIPSTDDARVANSPMRHAYRVLSDEEKAGMAAIKDAGQALLDAIEAHVPTARHAGIASEKAEEAVMWAVKGLTA